MRPIEQMGLTCAKVKDALALAMERLEINDYDGEEAEPMQEIGAAQTAFDAICRDVISEAPALVEALRDLVAGNYGQPRGVTVPALDNARAILARIDGAAPNDGEA